MRIVPGGADRQGRPWRRVALAALGLVAVGLARALARRRPAIKGIKAKQPFAIAMRDGSPFGIAGIWENWKEPASGEWQRTFAIVAVPPNELLAQIHNRMPAILGSADYERWLGDESDPHDLLRPFPSELIRMWPISTRVNKPENDEPSILDPITTLVA